VPPGYVRNVTLKFDHGGPARGPRGLVPEVTGAGGLWIIIGLGNPGRIHHDSRHNVGAMAVDALAGGLAVFEREGLCLVRPALIGWTPVLLAKPLTYIDRSGEAVRLLLRSHAGDPARTVILYDDALLPFGFVRVRSRGVAQTDDAMRSIVVALGVREVPRIRIGIGLASTTQVSLKMLREDFTDAERERLPAILGFRAI
jgi:peptidyl-tRNA hydrolase, PTH1 family